MRSWSAFRSIRPPTSRYQSPEYRKYRFVRTQPFGCPVVPDVYSSAHSVEASPAIEDRAPPNGVGTSSLSVTTGMARPVWRAAVSTSPRLSARTNAALISECATTYSSPLTLRSELRDTTDQL